MYRTMVIDDEKWTLMGICRTFPWAEFGFADPIALTDPEDALSKILSDPPDVVFVDIRMPALSGLELIAAARQANIASEFVILSGLQDFEHARAALQVAVFDYILKPLHADAARELLSRLKSHLDSFDKSPRSPAAAAEIHARLVATAASLENEDGTDSFTQLVNHISSNLAQPLMLKDVAAKFY